MDDIFQKVLGLLRQLLADPGFQGLVALACLLIAILTYASTSSVRNLTSIFRLSVKGMGRRLERSPLDLAAKDGMESVKLLGSPFIRVYDLSPCFPPPTSLDDDPCCCGTTIVQKVESDLCYLLVIYATHEAIGLEPFGHLS